MGYVMLPYAEFLSAELNEPRQSQMSVENFSTQTIE